MTFSRSYTYISLILKDIWIDLGLDEKAAGLTYVALTRVRAISDLMESMSYNRLESIKKTSNPKYRVLKEIRLNQLYQTTISKAKQISQ